MFSARLPRQEWNWNSYGKQSGNGEQRVAGVAFSAVDSAAATMIDTVNSKHQLSPVWSSDLIALAGYSVLQRVVRDVGFVGQAL